MDYNLNPRVIWQNFDVLLQGLALGLLLAIGSIAIGCVIGLIGAFASRSPHRIVRRIASLYVTIVRNLPILLIILFVFFALPQLGVTLGRIESFVASLSIYAGAYLTEVFRAGLLGVPQGVVEAGKTIGLRRFQINRHIVFPIMLRNALPSLGNNFISLFKDTSLAAAIAIPELTYYARKITTETFRVVEAWLTATIMYVLVCYLIALIMRAVEARYGRM